MTEEQKNTKLQDNIEMDAENQSEVIFDEVSEEAQMGNDAESQDELKAAQDKIRELEAKIEEMDNRYLRLQADFDNSRRRARLDIEAAHKYRAQNLVTDLLPALDNLERAMGIEADNDQTKTLIQGMQMIHNGLLESLKKEGVEVIEAVGKEFDPHIHQAVMQVDDAGYESNIVVEEFQKGYMLKDRVIRPSMVKVNQ
ncbi:molecular chaperone GrpE [Peribacillus deserti]|uniref:Protein GrpE n=1 Tax=Peribacillus deserti TaxID=673318 RepID=A0ABS2QF93_9BACI|nr:nucleotide exchange factor GrpE [Peribacillus deserti]MBM7691820.1 molecular chaperone GrpE [Peribacillus deserti]